MSWLDVYTTSVDALLYGLFGAAAGALITWLIGKHLWAKPLHDARNEWRAAIAELREHTDATEMLARNLGQQTQHLATIADRLTAPQPGEPHA